MNRNVGYTPEAKAKLLSTCFQSSRGGRGLKKQVRALIAQPLSHAIAKNSWKNGANLMFDIDETQSTGFAFRLMTQEEAAAHVSS